MVHAVFMLTIFSWVTLTPTPTRGVLGVNLYEYIQVTFAQTVYLFEAKHGVNYESLFEFIRWLLLYISLPASLLFATFIVAPQYGYDADTFELNTRDMAIDNFTLVCVDITQNSASNISESSYNSSLLLTRCCSQEYKKYLEGRIEKNEWYSYILDLIQGTVRLFLKVFLCNKHQCHIYFFELKGCFRAEFSLLRILHWSNLVEFVWQK